MSVSLAPAESSRISIDRRTKRRGDVPPITIDDLTGSAGAAFTTDNGALAKRAQRLLRLPPLVLHVGDQSCTIDQGRIVPGARVGGLVVEMTVDALAKVVAGVRSLWSVTPDCDIERGWRSQFLAWEHVVRALFDGQPLHEPGAAGFVPPTGAGFGLHRSFEPGDADHDIAAFVADSGFAHLTGWIDPELLRRIDDEVRSAAARATREEPHNLWTRLDDGSERCLRLRYALRSSPTMIGVVDGPAFSRLARLFADGHRRFPDLPYSTEALIKPRGLVAGITDLPWHRDCAGGGCAYSCAAYAVGLPLTATDAESGMLRVVAGSHRASTPAPGLVEQYDSALPIVTVPTQPGDLTIHLSCTLHGTTTSTDIDRAVVYTTFMLPPLEDP